MLDKYAEKYNNVEVKNLFVKRRVRTHHSNFIASESFRVS